MTDYAALDRYIDDRMPDWTAELAEFCRFRSEQGDPEGLRDAADWIAARLRRLGATVDVVELPGQPDVPPLVVGEIGEGPRTLNAVQHYDVQPAVPLELWTTPPYEPAIRDGRLYARGATDNKGELMPRIWAVEAYLATVGPLPCRIRFLVEGEEEYGSEHLDALLDQRPGIREVDGALIEGGGVDQAGRPEITGGVRGMAVVELICRTIAYDAHSSAATVLPSAPVRLAQALASLYDRDGFPALPGIEAGIVPPTAAQLEVVDSAPLDVVEETRREYGVERLLGGLDGVAALRAMTFAPTLNIQGLWSGFIGPGDKTITPAEAHARLDIRIVPDQEPEAIVAALRAHLAAAGVHRHRGHRRAGRAGLLDPVRRPDPRRGGGRLRGGLRPAGRPATSRCPERPRCGRSAAATGCLRPPSAAGRGTATPTPPTRTSGSTMPPTRPGSPPASSTPSPPSRPEPREVGR